jgi:hypothetical protein
MTRTALVFAALTTVWLGLAASAEPANAGWVERRNGCSRTCHWKIVADTCRSAFGIKVPCFVQKKRCGEDFCAQDSH